MGSALKVRHTAIAKQPKELARLKVVQGPDFGTIYVLLDPKLTIGRGEENDIILSDLKCSRVHAEISLSNGEWLIQDKGSANGIFYDGRSVRKTLLKPSDIFVLGETTLEFVSAETGTDLLVAPP